MDVDRLINIFFPTLYEVFLFVIVFYNLSKLKYSKAEFAIYVVTYAFFHLVMIYLAYNFRHSYVMVSVQFFSMLYFAVAAYIKTKIVALSGFYAVFAWVTAMISNLAGVSFFVLVGFVSTFDMSEYTDSFLHLAAVYIILAVFSFLFSYVIGNLVRNKMSGLDLSMTKKCANYLFGSSLIVLFFMHYYMFYRWELSTEVLGIIFLAMMGILVASLIFAISLFTDSVKSALHAQEKEYYSTQYHLMQESTNQIKSIRHDIKLHLAAINGYATKINANEITDYVSSILEDVSDAEVHSNTGNIAIDSIVNYKLKNAKQEGIKTEIRLALPPVLNVEAADLTIILGNLLDNALNAVTTVAENEEKKIKLDIEFSKEALIIQLDNTFDGIVNLDHQGIVTRKDENHHGHGLKNIKQTAEKYSGYMDISHEDKIFSVTILLCVDSNA